jgi:hypothetical protein
MAPRGLLGAVATAALLITIVPTAANAAAPTSTPEAASAAPAASAARAASVAPAKVAQALVSAWSRRDRAAAARVATPAAVTSIFAYDYRDPDEFAGCSGNACRFVHTSVHVPGGLNGLVLIVSGPKVTKVYRSLHVTKPAVAAKHLFGAWQRGDRYLALEVAAKPAVATLFRTKYKPGEVNYTFQGCSKEAKGYGCAYSYDGGAMFLHLKGSATRGYDVRTISYIAD